MSTAEQASLAESPVDETTEINRIVVSKRHGWRIDAPHRIGKGFNDAHVIGRLIVDLAGVRQLEAEALSGGLDAVIGGTRHYRPEQISAATVLLDEDVKQQLQRAIGKEEAMWSEFEHRFGFVGIPTTQKQVDFRDATIKALLCACIERLMSSCDAYSYPNRGSLRHGRLTTMAVRWAWNRLETRDGEDHA